MWSFTAIFLIIVFGLALLAHPTVVRVLGALMALYIFFLIALVVTLVIWIAIGAAG